MSARRAVAILAVLVGASVLAAAGAWFLRGGAPGAPGVSEGERVGEPAPASTDGPPPEGAPPPRAPAPASTPFGRLRLLDETTRQPVPFGRGCEVQMLLETEGRSLRTTLAVAGVEEGRWVLTAPFSKEYDPRRDFPRVAVDAARVLVRVPGYARLSLSANADLDGERERLLRPVPPSVKGTFVPGPGVDAASFLCELHPAPGGERPGRPGDPPAPPEELEPPVLPNRPGKFAVYDVPDGRWRLEAWAAVPGGEVARAVRVFEKAGETVDLGEVLLVAPVTIRARVVGRDGSGILDPGLTLQRAGDGDPGTEGGQPDKDGWVEFRGVEAGAEYLVTSSVKGVEQVVHAPAEGGKVVPVELRSEVRGVRCRIRFTVGGQEPVKWGDVFESPTLEPGAWKKDGTLEHEMAPGEYLVGIWAQPVGRDGMRRCSARFTVPEGEAWEKTIDLREGN